MGTFAERTNGDYHLLFADQGKTNFRFPFLFPVCSKQTEVAISVSSVSIYTHVNIYIHGTYTYTHRHIYIYVHIYVCCCFRRKMENGSLFSLAQSFFLSPFTFCSS
jgi:hypothetical protein